MTHTITINFQPVSEGLPPTVEGFGYSIECITIVDNDVFDRALMYYPKEKGWVFADLALGNDVHNYREELGGNHSKVTHWAPWPTVQENDVLTNRS